MCALKVFHADLPAHYHTNFDVTIKCLLDIENSCRFFFLRSSLSFYFFIFFPRPSVLCSEAKMHNSHEFLRQSTRPSY